MTLPSDDGALVCCLRGCNRSAAALLAILVAITGSPWRVIFDYVKKLRPVIDVFSSGPGSSHIFRTRSIDVDCAIECSI
jgi:hypothetical protein